MSYFAVMVFGDNVEEQLAPYHEFESTGEDNEFIQEIDKTRKLRKAYKKSTVTKIKDKDGNFLNPYSDMFYREPTPEEIEKYHLDSSVGSYFGKEIKYYFCNWGDGKGYRAKIFDIPEGFEEVELKNSEIKTFAEYCESDGYPILKAGETPDLEEKHKFGYILLNKKGNVSKVIDRTNPNSKWDWWEEGGRYNECWRNKNGGYFVSGIKEEMDIEAMEEEDAKNAAKTYDKVAAAYPLMKWKSWKSILKNNKKNYEKAKSLYHQQEAIEAISKLNLGVFFNADELLIGRDAYIQKAKDNAYLPYAFILNGKWYSKGDMRWWGISSNEDETAYIKAFKQAFAEADPKTQITIVDCHI